PFEVVAHDVVPYELVGAQAREGAGELAAVDTFAAQECRLARSEKLARHVDADLARVGEIKHRRKERRAFDTAIAPRGEHRHGARARSWVDIESARSARCGRQRFRA